MPRKKVTVSPHFDLIDGTEADIVATGVRLIKAALPNYRQQFRMCSRAIIRINKKVITKPPVGKLSGVNLAAVACYHLSNLGVLMISDVIYGELTEVQLAACRAEIIRRIAALPLGNFDDFVMESMTTIAPRMETAQSATELVDLICGLTGTAIFGHDLNNSDCRHGITRKTCELCLKNVSVGEVDFHSRPLPEKPQVGQNVQRKVSD